MHEATVRERYANYGKQTNDYLKREQLVCQLSHGWNQEQKTQCPIGYEFEPRRGNENDSEYASLHPPQSTRRFF